MNFKKFFIILLMFIHFILFAPLCYAYYDGLIFSEKGYTVIGNWGYMYPNYQANVKEIEKYINIKYNENVQSFLLNSITHFENEERKLNNLYENYTMGQLIKLVDLSYLYKNSFLDINNTLRTNNEPYQISSNESYKAGDTKQYFQIIHTANLTSSQFFNMSFFIESNNGENLSDFTVEVLYDSNAFTDVNPFGYYYTLYNYGRSNSSNFTKDINISLNNNNSKLTNNINYTTRIRQLFYNYTSYQHILNSSTFEGNWCRFYQGPNYYLDLSLFNFSDKFKLENTNTRTGLILMGRHDGSASQMNVLFKNRNPKYQDNSPIIPIIINVSRASNSQTGISEVSPIIKINIFGA